MTELERRLFPTAADFEAWLEEHHASSPGVLVVLGKKGSGVQTVSYAEAVEIALCFGWIDGQAKRLDDATWQQRFTPRRARSSWSRINVGRAEQLVADGRMRPAGQAEIDRAKADGRWAAAYDSPARAQVPADLQERLDADPQAKGFFQGLNGANRFAILYRLQTAKKPETRQRRLEAIVERLRRGEKFHP